MPRFRILHKLFLALLVTSGVVLVLLGALMKLNLDRGFLDYLNQLEEEQNTKLLKLLESRYDLWGSWEPIRDDRRLWNEMINLSRGQQTRQSRGQGAGSRGGPNFDFDQSLDAAFDDFRPPRRPRDGVRPGPGGFDQERGRPGPPPRRQNNFGDSGRRGPPRGDGPSPRRRGPGDGPPRNNGDAKNDGNGPGGDRPPPRRPPPRRDEDLRARLFLFDVDRSVIVGRPGAIEGAEMIPILVNGAEVGFLGVLPLREVSADRDLRFIERQAHFFYITLGVLILLAALVSVVLARHFSQRVGQVAGAARKLSSGDYATRVKPKGSDEIGQLAFDVNNLAHTLEESEEARRRWTADISHELRTPLAVLRGEIEALRDGVRQVDADTLESLHVEAVGLNKLVDDLYQLALSDIGALNYRKETMEPLDVLEHCASVFRGRAESRGLSLDYAHDDDLLVVMEGDRDRLLQLFTNILENSCRYTDAGGSIRIGFGYGQGRLRITLEDSAPGVAPELCEKLFERHFRTDESGRRERRGAGLGLAICKNIVEAHEGTIVARPSALGGVCVTVTFPARNG